jgi:hypothetical protein
MQFVEQERSYMNARDDVHVIMKELDQSDTPQDDFSDTSPQVEELQRQLLRNAGPSRRFRMCVSLTRFAFKNARDGFNRTHPKMKPEKQTREFIKALYGEPLYNDLFGRRTPPANPPKAEFQQETDSPNHQASD